MADGLKRWLYRLLALTVIAGAVLYVRDLLRDSDARVEQFTQRIRLVEPPPPPPPPKIEPKRPEPQERREVEVEKPDQPENTDDQAALDDRLGVDAEGSGGGDAFGLAAKKGGKDLLATARIGGGDVRRFSYYASQIERALERVLSRDQSLRGIRYSVIIRLWVGPAGGLERFELTRSSGDPAIDAHLKQALATLDSLGLPPPQDLPQPVRLRITSRLAG